MSNPVNLQKLDSIKFKQFIDSFDYILSDCDGVIWTPKPNPESGKWVNLLKKLGKKVYYVSNNSLRSQENYEQYFKTTNIENGYENLTVPSIAIAEYLKSINFTKVVFCVACKETVAVLKSYGFRVKTGDEQCPKFYLDLIVYLEDDPEVGAVVFDSNFATNLPQMQQAVTYLRRNDVLFINGATDHHIVLKENTVSLGPAIFTRIVAEEVNRTPIQLAKPGKMFAEFAMRRAGIPQSEAGRVLFIGDMIEQDIKLGKVAGFQTLLVLTNISLEKMSAHDIKPDYYAESLGSLVPQVEKLLKEM